MGVMDVECSPTRAGYRGTFFFLFFVFVRRRNPLLEVILSQHDKMIKQVLK